MRPETPEPIEEYDGPKPHCWHAPVDIRPQEIPRYVGKKLHGLRAETLRAAGITPTGWCAPPPGICPIKERW